MAAFKTLQFLPEIFKTDTNRKFLNATTDQLVSEPNLIKINGYIGRKLAPSYKTSDSYITEPTKDRQDYQLEPSIIIKNPTTNNLLFATTYTDIINKIAYFGGLVDNHSRLFENEFYSYDPHIDLDKFVNYAQYYWLENGPDAVTISSGDVPLEKTFVINYDLVSNTFKIDGYGNISNPILSLARGGTYSFVVNSPGNKFYIQTGPGQLGVDSNAPNLTTRSILGINQNGIDVGTLTFTVPQVDAQVEWSSMPLVGSVEYATNLSYKQIQGATLEEINFQFGGIDGIVSSLDGKKLIFVNNEYLDNDFWADAPVTVSGGIAFIENYDILSYDQNDALYDAAQLIPFGNRNDIFQISILPDALGTDRIILQPIVTVNDETKIKVVSGENNVGKEYYSRLGLLNEVPVLTSQLDILFYQSDQSDSAVGAIQIIDPVNAEIDPGFKIIGQKNYTTPNGIAFTNGLKITFDSTVPAPYANNTYYVEGVGTAINLVLVEDLTCPELNDDLSDQDYFTINRSSLDLNAWTRSNRWFHVEVLEKTAEYNNTDLVINQNYRAQRPIIEFSPNLQLYNFGIVAKKPIDLLDNVITNAFSQVQGVLCSSTTELTLAIGDTTVTFTHGDRVVFSVDENLDVRNKIYNFTIEVTKDSPLPLVRRAYIVEAEDFDIQAGNTIIVKNGSNGNKQWHYNGTSWIESQQKLQVNQAPRFDIVNSEGISFSDQSVYPGSSFTGTKIFSYKQGSGITDPILGFSLSYKNLVTQGDIQFENNYDTDSFNFILSSGVTNNISVNSGLLQKNITLTTSTRINTWTINSYFSKQYQTFTFSYDGTTNLFPVDILPDESRENPNIKVVINKRPIKAPKFIPVQVVDKQAILIDPSELTVGDVVFVSIYSSQSVSDTAFYQIPLNFDINSLNVDLQTLTLGQMRNHLIETSLNDKDVTGSIPGKSNLRDLSFLNKGGSILQHSAPAIYAGLFLNHPTMNFTNALQLAAKEYSQFKIKFLELASSLELDRTNVADSVDSIMSVINSVKNDTFPWHYSDMVPHGSDDKTILPPYTVFDTDIRSYEITSIFNDTVASNKAVYVYCTRQLENVTSTFLLVKGQDYYFDQNRPAIVIQNTFNLLYNDILTIVEYNNTDGSYVPETPTKLGLYPKFAPSKYLDSTYITPIQVIQGHDGSITPAFNDFRDEFLLELEKRIYNNCKIAYNPINFNITDYMPGKWRITDYSLQEFNQLLTQNFLRWTGTNRVDFTTNTTFSSSNGFTWNYKKFRDVINGESLPGTWRSIFRYFFDTDRPHSHPWEMLGFSEKPDYWDDRYGPAPYTGGNFILWNDLEIGYIHAGPRAGIDFRYSRPRVYGDDGTVIQRGLTDIIPVDDNGNLRNPSEFLVTDFDSANANLSYSVGDIGPTELAWRRSSDFPYAVQFALAIGKPAKYFSLLADLQNYYRSAVTGQFINATSNLHLQPSAIKINGYLESTDNLERAAGYINWIRDYMKSLGIADASAVIKENLAAISVQLSYKMAGFSDKKFIELLAEQLSPSSINDSVIVPEENYSIELYKGAPLNRLTYSAVLIERSVNGYTVSGYNTSNPFFTIIPSLPNNNAYTIEASGERGVIYKDAKNQRFSIPYGFEFNKKQQVVDFLVSYQRYLESQGFIFIDRDNQLNETKNWILSAKEFLHWSTQGWRSGNILVLSPVAETLSIFSEQAVVDEISNTFNGGRVLDLNYQQIKKNNFTVVRENNIFTIKSLNDQVIGLAEFNLVQYEHLLLLDNTTAFNDIIYVPETGNRQYRLRLVGAKTGLWNGSLELPGYIYSNKTVEEWQPGKDYLKGSIVSNRFKFYTALENITAADVFQTTKWQQIDQNELSSGMINNFATNAADFLKYYDINDQPLDEKVQLFSNGLIGFRPREYFTNLGIDVTTQAKFYQGLLKQGGTVNAINALKGAQFNNLTTELEFYENWAIRVGEYGATELNRFVEFVLNDFEFDNNPAVFQVTSEQIQPQPDIANFNENDVYKINGQFTPYFLRNETKDLPYEIKPLPTAGFVNLNDVNAAIFSIDDYQSFNAIVDEVGVGYTIWVAKDNNNNWNVFRATSVPGIAYILRYSIDDRAELVISADHGLMVDDSIILKNFDSRYDGIYRVISVIDSNRIIIVINNNLQDLIDNTAVISNGFVYLLKSSKLSTPVDVVNYAPYAGWLENDKIWVENLDSTGNWGVYNRISAWNFQSKLVLGSSQYTGNDNFGKSVVMDTNALYLYSGAPLSGVGKVSAFTKNIITNDWDSYGFVGPGNTLASNFGRKIATATVGSSSFLVVAAPNTINNRGAVYVFENQVLLQIITNPTSSVNDNFGSSLALSDDAKYLYIGASGANKVFCYALGYPRLTTGQTIVGDGSNTTFTVYKSINSATDVMVIRTLDNSEYYPFIDYTLSSYTNGVNLFTFTGLPSTTISDYNNVAATGGTGSNARFNVSYRLTGPGESELFEIGKTYVISTVGTTDFTLIGAASNTPGVSFTATGSVSGLTAPLSSGSSYTTGEAYGIFVTLSHAGSGYGLGNTLTIPGTSLGGSSPANNVTITIGSTAESVAAGINIVFTTAPVNNQEIAFIQRENRYVQLDTLPLSSESISGSGFGSSLACNTDGSIIAVGAENTVVDSIDDSGAVYVYHRTVNEYTTNGLTNIFTFPDDLNTVYRVYLNDELIYDISSLAGYNPSDIVPSYFVVDSKTIQYGGFGIPTLAEGNTIKIETNQFVLDEILYQENTGLVGSKFGRELAMCNTGCNIYVSSPDYLEPNYRFGLVTRFLDVGRVYGSITGNIQNPTVTIGESIIINNRQVIFTNTTLSSVVAAINAANIPGVTASIVDNKIHISSDVIVVAARLKIVSGNIGTPLADLGIETYQYVQSILHPDQDGEIFGTAIQVDQTNNILVIGSDGADITIAKSFDTSLSASTIFDSGGTKFIDLIKDSGAVYIYNLMTNPYQDVNNHNLYAFTQKLTGPGLASGFNFGAAFDIKSKNLVVGVANDYGFVTDGGSLYHYYNENLSSGWQLLRYKEPRVDIGAVKSSYIYNTVSQNIIDFFDYLDPVKGKLLGVVDQELDYKEEYDPASYNNSSRSDTINNTNFYWTDRQIGRTWLDLATLRFIDYEQDIIQYRLKNWGSIFPGSIVTIYEWIESEFLPSQYATVVGDGIPKYPDNSAYTSITLVDPATGIISQKYYYWVSGKTSVDIIKSKRSLSVRSLENYIINPKDQGIPYLALLANNSVAVYNVNNKLVGNDVVLHIENPIERNTQLIHNEWQLVQQNAGAETIPIRAINKLKDSLIGVDAYGQIVPDNTLKAQNKLGILNYPRQTMVINRLLALENYISLLNNIFTQYPVLLITTPSSLFLNEPLPTTGFDTQTDNAADLLYIDTDAFPDGYKILVPNDATYEGKWAIYIFNLAENAFELYRLQSFKTNLYWTPKVWYDSTFQVGKDINYTVNIYSDLQAITSEVGDYLKVLDNGNGKWLLYEVLSDFTLNLIGAEEGTLEVSSKIYDVSAGIGYDTAVFDSIAYDPQAVIEFQNIYDSVYREILIGNLSTEFNKLFLNIINYIFAEQKSPDWIFKTSFIDVFHRLRTLEQFPSYIRDNQSFYNDYIKEVKPYRTQIREYVPSYYKIDNADGDWTDFDLPSAYDTRYGTFRSPDISLSSDSALFSTDIYSDWANNYKLKVTDYIIGNIGLNYILPPNVEITGGGGSGAEAITTLFGNGKVQSIIVTNAGSGYTSTPNVFINGDGVGATAYPLLKNEFYASQANLSYNLVRSIDNTIKFDRISYTSNLIIWQPNTAYANTIVTVGNITSDTSNIYISNGNIIVYNSEAYLAINANVSTESIFDFTRFNKLDSGNVLLNSLDRIIAYYNPTVGMAGKNLDQLVNGISYPGTKIVGPDFRANAFSITSNILSFNYEGLTINSGNIAALDFIKLGFELDRAVRIEANLPFNFQNNGYFNIVGIERDALMLTGKPIATTHKLFLNNPVSATAGSYITQANTLANAYVLQTVTNSTTIDIIYTVPEFTKNTAELISINGFVTSANVVNIRTGGNANVTISYLDQQFIIDSNIYSTYLDTELGTRPQDINIVGGSYVDLYSSHAPEELLPGKMFDALEIRVFSNTVGNSATYGYRMFKPMSADIIYTRIAADYTTTLANNLHITDNQILLVDASKLPDPSPSQGIPGIVFINGERISYYQKYDTAKMATAVPWTVNTQIATGSLISLNSNVYLTIGNVYANANTYINSANIQLVVLNSLKQIRRGVDGTGAANVILAGNLVADSSLEQLIPNAQIFGSNVVTGNVKVTSNVTFKLVINSPISANLGDYITQFVGNTGNARVLDTVTNSNVIPVDFVSGTFQLASNIGTRINLVSLTSGVTSTSSNITSFVNLGQVNANGNVVLTTTSVLRSNIWEQFSTTLENSSTVGAQFIRAEPSYTP